MINMPKKSKSTSCSTPTITIEQYDYKGTCRLNNPPVGLVTHETDVDEKKKTYKYDPHLDPQLIWAGKAENTSFEVPTVSLHVHERIDPRRMIRAVRNDESFNRQFSLFEFEDEKRPLREAIEFYKHKNNWSNRLIAGDSLLVMNSLIEKEGMEGKVQMIYIDPPYGIKYGSNFQPFVNKRDVRDRNDEDLTQEPEMIKAFRDTWELGIHSYLTYLRDRLLLARELLHESGSVFVQISDENIHYVREIMDEVFGKMNFISQISFKTSPGDTTKHLPPCLDYLIWYGKNKSNTKFRKLLLPKSAATSQGSSFDWIENRDGICRALTKKEKDNPHLIPEGSRLFRWADPRRKGSSESARFGYEFNGEMFFPGHGMTWKTTKEGLDKLKSLNRLGKKGNQLNYKRYLDDFPATELLNVWTDTMNSFMQRNYVVETNPLVVIRCLLMATDPGDLVLDITCGSGTTAYVAEQWGRRWITCDTSRVATTLAKQRLMTSVFDYYKLAYPEEGVASGFVYKTVPHITLKSIANNEPLATEVLYDQPIIDKSKTRITGPFTVEAVPSPVVKPLTEIEGIKGPADDSIARSGESLRQAEWRDELLKTGIRGKGGQILSFSRIEPLPGVRWLHADGETIENEPKRVVISFGPEHSPLEQRQVGLAIEDAHNLVPKPKIVVFAAFQFDPEASKDIDEMSWPGVTLLKAQMNADILTEDLKKKRANNESFWLIGQPDVRVEEIKNGEEKGKLRVEVLGFDYYDTKKGVIVSGDTRNIAMWMLDTDYDGRSLFPNQVFFPMAGPKDGWDRLARSLKTQIDEEKIEAFRGTVSLPFVSGKCRRIAVKIVDDRGIESLKIVPV